METWEIPPKTKGLLDAIPSKGRTLSSYHQTQLQKELRQKGLVKASFPGEEKTESGLAKKYWEKAEETLADRLVEVGRSAIEYAHLHNTSGKEIWHGPSETSKISQRMGKSLLGLIKSEEVDYNYKEDIERCKPKTKMNRKEAKALLLAGKALDNDEIGEKNKNASYSDSGRGGGGGGSRKVQDLIKKKVNNTRMNVVSITHDPNYVDATNITRIEAAWKTSTYTTEEVCMSCNLLTSEVYNATNLQRVELCCTMLKILCKRHAAARDSLLRDMEGFLQSAYPKYAHISSDSAKRMAFVIESLTPFYATELARHSCIQKIMRLSLAKGKLACKLISNQAKRKKALQTAKSYPLEIRQKIIFNLNLLSEDLLKQWRQLSKSGNCGEPIDELLLSYLNTLFILTSKSNVEGDSERNELYRINRKVIIQEGGLILLSSAYAHRSQLKIRRLAEKIYTNLAEEVVLLLPLLKSCIIQSEFIPFIHSYCSSLLRSKEERKEEEGARRSEEKEDQKNNFRREMKEVILKENRKETVGGEEKGEEARKEGKAGAEEGWRTIINDSYLPENREKLLRILATLERLTYSAYLYSENLRDEKKKSNYKAFEFQGYNPDTMWLQRSEDIESFLQDNKYLVTQVAKKDSFADDDDDDDNDLSSDDFDDRTGKKQKFIFKDKKDTNSKKNILFDENAFETSHKIEGVMKEFLFQDDLIQAIIEVTKLGEEDLLLPSIRILHNLACTRGYDCVLDNIMRDASVNGVKVIIDALHCPNVEVIGHCSLFLLQLASTNEGRGQLIGNGVADFLKTSYLQHQKAHWNIPYLFALRILLQLCSRLEPENTTNFMPQLSYAPNVMSARYAFYQDLFDIIQLSEVEEIIHTGNYLWKLGIEVEFLDFLTKDYSKATKIMPERHITMQAIARLLSAPRIRTAIMLPNLLYQSIFYSISVFDMDLNEVMDTAEYEKDLMPTLIMGIEAASQTLTTLCNEGDQYPEIANSKHKLKPKEIIIDYVSDPKKTSLLQDIRDLLHSCQFKQSLSKTNVDGPPPRKYQTQRRIKMLSLSSIATLTFLRAITPIPYAENNANNYLESQQNESEEAESCDTLIEKFTGLYFDSLLSILTTYKGKFSPLVIACIQTLKSFSVTYNSASTLFRKGTIDIVRKYLPKEHVVSSIDASKSILLKKMSKRLVPAQYAALKDLVAIPPSFWAFVASIARVQTFRQPLYIQGILKFALERIHIISECEIHDRYSKNEIFMLLARCAHLFTPRLGALDDLLLGRKFETAALTVRALGDDYLRYNALTFACSMMRDLLKGVPSFCKAGIIPILLSYAHNYKLPHPLLRRTLEGICMITKHPNRPYHDAIITRQFRKDLFHISNCRDYNKLKVNGIIPLTDLASYVVVLINKSNPTPHNTADNSNDNAEEQKLNLNQVDFETSNLPAHSFQPPNGNYFDCGPTKCGSLRDTYLGVGQASQSKKEHHLPLLKHDNIVLQRDSPSSSSASSTSISNEQGSMNSWRMEYKKTIISQPQYTKVTKNVDSDDITELRMTRPIAMQRTNNLSKQKAKAKMEIIKKQTTSLTRNEKARQKQGEKLPIRGCQRLFLNKKLLMTNPSFDCVGEEETYLNVVQPTLTDPVPVVHEEGKDGEPHLFIHLQRNHGVYPKRDIYQGAAENEANVHEYATARYAAVVTGTLAQR